METKTGDDMERSADIEGTAAVSGVASIGDEAAVNGEQGDVVPSREPAAVVSVIAAAALSLMGIAGVATPADASIAPMDEALPPPEAATPPKAARSKSPRRISPDVRPNIDRSGRKRFGKASFYARMFAGRKMADGTPMRPAGDTSVSRNSRTCRDWTI